MSRKEKESKGYGFGTFAGVFTPSILTIIGVVMYLRFGWMLGNVGLTTSLIIVTAASSITFLTELGEVLEEWTYKKSVDDLAQSLGVPGQPEHPKVIEKMEELVKLAREKGKFLGTYVESVEMFKKWSDAGVQFLAYQSDIDTMASKLKERSAEAKKAVGRE